MKIAFFVDHFPKLSETFVLNQITGLIDQGHEVDIYPTSPMREALQHEDVNRYQLLRRCYYPLCVPAKKHRRIVKSIGLAIRSMSYHPNGLIKLLRAALHYPSSETFLGHVIKTASMHKSRPEYDIIQCHFGHNGLRAALYRDAQLLSGSIITAFHGYDVACSPSEEFYRPLFIAGDHFLPISEYWRRRLQRLGCPEHKLTVHKMGIDCERFQYKAPDICSKGSIKILSVARLTEKKGLEFGIKAVAGLIHQGLPLKYDIIGEGPLKGQLTRLIYELNASHSIHLIGSRRQDEVVTALRDSDVLLAPSITAQDGDQEGIPVVLMEAMALGTLVVSSLHSGIPELIEDQSSGLLVRERDVNGLSEMIAWLSKNRQSWLPMAENARKIVMEKHDIKKLNSCLIELYKDIKVRRKNITELTLVT